MPLDHITCDRIYGGRDVMSSPVPDGSHRRHIHSCSPLSRIIEPSMLEAFGNQFM